MICRYTTTFEDFRNAQNLHLRRGKFSALRRAFWIWILPIAGVLSAAVLIYDIHWHHFSLPPLVGGILAATAWFGIFIAVARPISWRRAYKQMKNGRSDSDSIEFEIAGNELISRIPGVSEGRFKRNAVLKFAQDEKIALLYVAKKRFLLLPKRALDDSQWDVLRGWLANKEQPHAD